MIPKKIHYVWVGPVRLPDRFRRYIDGWRSLNPDYEVIAWNEDNLDFSSRFMRGAYAVGAWNRVSNLARAMALLQHGGIYLDTDIELRRPLDGLLDSQCFLGFQHRDRHQDWLNNAVMGAVPGHWLMERICRVLTDEFDGWRVVGSSSGPGLVTRLLLDEGLAAYTDAPQRVRDVTLYPTRSFYPYFLGETFTEACVTPDTYAIHHWAASWVPAGGARGYHMPLARRALNGFGRHCPSLAFAAMWRCVGLRRRLATAAGRP